MYRAYLKDLIPGTEYTFMIRYNLTGYESKRYKFKTTKILQGNDKILIAIGKRMSNTA